MRTLTFAIRTGLLLAIGLGLSSSAMAQAKAGESVVDATVPVQAPWQQKLDGALQTAADAAPEAVLRVVVRLAIDAPADKAQMLAALGFPVLQRIDAVTFVMSLTALEAMVLAEDATLERFTLDSTKAE